jgi:hypothetical protein
VAHGAGDPVRAAAQAAGDPAAIALIGPYRSAAVAEALEVTAPTGLPLLAPVATWAGMTHDDEPGCDDPARHHGTVLLVARVTVVAARVAADVRAAGRRALPTAPVAGTVIATAAAGTSRSRARGRCNRRASGTRPSPHATVDEVAVGPARDGLQDDADRAMGGGWLRDAPAPA